MIRKFTIMLICLLVLTMTTSCNPIESETTLPSLTSSTSQTSTSSINIPKPNTMTIQSGNNAIQAEAYPIWSHDLKTNVAADYERNSPQQMENKIQYLTLDLNKDSLTPFTPYIKGKEVYGQYELYNDEYEQIPFFEPSGLVPQTYLFQNAKPGKYRVVLTTYVETDDVKASYQYFFGVIVPETETVVEPTDASGITETMVQPIEVTLPTSDTPLSVYQSLATNQPYKIDLDGDGIKERVECSVVQIYRNRQVTFTVNEQNVIFEGAFLKDKFFLVDIDTSDDYIDVAFQELGEMTYARETFVYFDGTNIVYRGSIRTTNSNESAIKQPDFLGDIQFDGKCGLIADTRSDFFFTWFYFENWKINSEGRLEIVPRDYYLILNGDEEFQLLLIQDLPLYADQNATKATIIAKAGETVNSIKTVEVERKPLVVILPV